MWQLLTTPQTNEDGVAYTAYGFCCDECCVTDFSSVREEVEQMLDILNKNEVSPLHVYDVIEDSFAQTLTTDSAIK